MNVARRTRIAAFPTLLRALLALLTLCGSVHAQVPPTINYQGFLTTGTPAVAVNGPQSFTFRIYDDVNAPIASALWTELQLTVPVTNGIFNAVLGSPTAFPQSLVFGKPYFLGVQVNADAEMTPRQALMASPFALRAMVADGVNAGTPLKIGSDSIVPCDATHAGSLRWNASAGAMEVCDGTAWKSVAFSTFTIGGTVSGLTGTLVLQNNLGNNLNVSANGSINFPIALPTGSLYDVTVLTQPAGQTCTVTNGAGTVANANVTNVAVDCVATVLYSATVTVLSTFSGSGIVTSAPAGINCGATCTANYSSGTVVTLTAAASAESFFIGWGIACVNTTGTCILTMNAAKSISANFMFTGSDPLNCGAIGLTCGNRQMCSASTCVCRPGLTLAAGVCVNLATDPHNCGSAGAVCSVVAPRCLNGTCTAAACTSGLISCGAGGGLSSCVNPVSDPLNCGLCGNLCSVNEVCVAGNCRTF